MKPRKTFGVLAKDQRKWSALEKPVKKRPVADENTEMSGNQAEQRKRIVPTVLEQYDKNG